MLQDSRIPTPFNTLYACAIVACPKTFAPLRPPKRLSLHHRCMLQDYCIPTFSGAPKPALYATCSALRPSPSAPLSYPALTSQPPVPTFPLPV
eukprot:354109-Chlamydomonas_euryale.AAC.3